MAIYRSVLTAAAAAVASAACAFGTASPAGAAGHAPAATSTPLMPTSTSWPDPHNGVVLGYPSHTTGAPASLFQTANDGRSWRRLPAPPVPFPADNNEPQVTWAGGAIVVTDGTHVVITRDDGRHWAPITVPSSFATGFYLGTIVIAAGRITALATSPGNGNQSTTVDSGSIWSGALRAVPGLSVTGGETYGDLTASGGALQAYLGSSYTSAHYWISRAGGRFAPAALPCPAPLTALLGGVREGQPVALCSGSPSDIGLGENDKQISIAPHLGGRFSPSGTVTDSGNQQGFAAASDTSMTIATAGGLVQTFDAGQTWSTALVQPNGSFWTSLAFPSASTGVAVADTVDNSGNIVGYVYRTTDGGHTWHALTLP